MRFASLNRSLAPGRALPACERLRGDGGSTLIEVVVGVAVVLVILTGVLMTLDVSTAATALHRHRALAVDLAQQDQERMRSIAITSLSNYHAVRSVTLDGVTYTVESSADWVRDASGAVGCTADQSNPDYLALTSTVVWPRMAGARPVVMEGLSTPNPGAFNSGQGSAALQVTDRDGLPVPGVATTFNGPVTLNDTTDANGCVVVGNVNAGTYSFAGSLSGYVDLAGNAVLSTPAVVAAHSTRLTAAPYDRAATATVQFDTSVGTTATPAAAFAVRVTAPGLPRPGYRTFVPPVAPASVMTVPGLFPFSSGYGIYAGTCTSADPRRSPTSDATYFDTHSGQIVSDRGGTPTVTVRVPAINVHVRRLVSGTIFEDVANANVRVTPTGTGCGTFPIQRTTAAGRLPAPGYPFGNYTVCVDDGSRRTVSGIAVANTNPAGTAEILVTLPVLQTAANCP